MSHRQYCAIHSQHCNNAMLPIIWSAKKAQELIRMFTSRGNTYNIIIIYFLYVEYHAVFMVAKNSQLCVACFMPRYLSVFVMKKLSGHIFPQTTRKDIWYTV